MFTSKKMKSLEEKVKNLEDCIYIKPGAATGMWLLPIFKDKDMNRVSVLEKSHDALSNRLDRLEEEMTLLLKALNMELQNIPNKRKIVKIKSVKGGK